MPRPETPGLVKGDRMEMFDGVPSRRDGKRYVPVEVVTVGPKFVHVVPISMLELPHYKREPSRYTRRFLLADMKEGVPAGRVGYPTTLATQEQAAYDSRLAAARDYVQRVAGLDVRSGSRFADPDMLVNLAGLLAEVLHRADEAD